MTNNSQHYPVDRIRRLLNAGFDEADLVGLLQDKFPQLSGKLGLGHGLRKDEIINAVMDYCRRHKDFTPLLDSVKEHDPELYADFADVSQQPLYGSSIKAPPQRGRKFALLEGEVRIGPWMLKAKVVVAVVLLVIVVGVCGTVGRPMVEQWTAVWLRTLPAPEIAPSGPQITVKAGEGIAIRANAKGASRYEWTLAGVGEISGPEGAAVVYTAPDEPGMAVLSVTAHNSRGASPPTSLMIDVLCPTIADAAGTVPPSVAIASITFVVNGVEQVVDDWGLLQASPGDRVEAKEVTICVDRFEGSGGRVYVEFNPVDDSGQVITSEVTGTIAVAVAPGLTTISGPDHTWTIGGDWRHFSVVVVHYPDSFWKTASPECEENTPYICEVDDYTIVPIR